MGWKDLCRSCGFLCGRSFQVPGRRFHFTFQFVTEIELRFNFRILIRAWNVIERIKWGWTRSWTLARRTVGERERACPVSLQITTLSSNNYFLFRINPPVQHEALLLVVIFQGYEHATEFCTDSDNGHSLYLLSSLKTNTFSIHPSHSLFTAGQWSSFARPSFMGWMPVCLLWYP